MAFQWRPIASHTQVRLEGFPSQTQTLNQQVRLQQTIEFHFCWSQLRSDSPNPETLMWQNTELNWTRPDLTLLKSTISNNLRSSFQIPPTGLCFKVASANNLLTSWVCPHKNNKLMDLSINYLFTYYIQAKKLHKFQPGIPVISMFSCYLFFGERG